MLILFITDVLPMNKNPNKIDQRYLIKSIILDNKDIKIKQNVVTTIISRDYLEVTSRIT